MSSLAYSHEDFEMSMGMIADGRVRLEPMHTSTVGLDDLDASLAGLAGGVGAEVKVLVDPRAG
jgi:(R,R)-butanediol dehydrogenase/meso-butanediol dehydrogenase/diacetyl reductase